MGIIAFAARMQRYIWCYTVWICPKAHFRTALLNITVVNSFSAHYKQQCCQQYFDSDIIIQLFLELRVATLH